MSLNFSGLDDFSQAIIWAVVVWSVAYFAGKVVESCKRKKK